MTRLKSTTRGRKRNHHLGCNSSAPPYWLTKLAPLGQVGSRPSYPPQNLSNTGPQKPLAYKKTPVFRNILDYGADRTGQFDSAEAINAAVEDGFRCGPACASTFTDGAIVYFPVSCALVAFPKETR